VLYSLDAIHTVMVYFKSFLSLIWLY